MALTPEDVVNKRFQPTKFREGYDQIEVDDFLDEIVTELRRLNKENDELRKRVADLQGGKGAAASTAPAENANVPAPVPAVQGGAADASAAKPVAAANLASTQSAASATANVAGGDQHRVTAESATGVLAMAQRLHDEYVSAGVEQRDKLIAEAKSKAESLVSDANAKSQKLVTDADNRSKKMVGDAEETSRKTLTDLEQKKSVLESKIDQLRGFERDYRGRLKTYIEGQLRDLEAKGSVETASTESAQR